jgi:hypothetical protein
MATFFILPTLEGNLRRSRGILGIETRVKGYLKEG